MLRCLDSTWPFRAVILDMDGLMLDTEIVEFRAWQRASADFGWSMSGEQYLQLIGRNHRDASALLTSWWEAQPATGGGLDAIRERAASYSSEDMITVKQGLPDLLDWAHREHVPLAVGSSSSRWTINERLGQVGLREAVDVIAAGDEVVHGKPAPDIFLLAAKRLGCDPRACVVIEDSDSGILAASAAGMTPFLVPDSSIPRVVPPAIRVKAYKTCDSLTEVLAVLRAASKCDHGPC